MNTYARTIAAGLCAAVLGSPTLAANFSGSSHDIIDFANGSEVSLRGTLIDAINLSNDGGNPTAATTINGVLFKSVAPGQFHEAGEDFANASFVYHGGDGYVADGLWTSGGAYDALADSQLFSIDNPNVNAGDGYGVVNLSPGTTYQLQVFMLDDRAGVAKTFPLQFQQVKWSGSADNIDNSSPAVEIGYMSGITIGGNGLTQANGEIATVYFTIDEGYNGLLVNTWDNGAFNGMQLRALPALLADYDGNNSVGPEDYALWRSTFGSTSNLAADGNLNGIVDAADYVVWRDAASGGGSGSGLGSGAVPEPSAILIGLLAVTVLGGTAQSRPRRG